MVKTQYILKVISKETEKVIAKFVEIDEEECKRIMWAFICNGELGHTFRYETQSLGAQETYEDNHSGRDVEEESGTRQVRYLGSQMFRSSGKALDEEAYKVSDEN